MAEPSTSNALSRAKAAHTNVKTTLAKLMTARTDLQKHIEGLEREVAELQYAAHSLGELEAQARIKAVNEKLRNRRDSLGGIECDLVNHSTKAAELKSKVEALELKERQSLHRRLEIAAHEARLSALRAHEVYRRESDAFDEAAKAVVDFERRFPRIGASVMSMAASDATQIEESRKRLRDLKSQEAE